MIEQEDPQGALVFADSARGDRKYENYERKYEELINGKKKLISKLLSKADTTVRAALMTSPGYQQLFDSYDIHGLWQLTEQVCMGRGAISVYALIVRLLQLKQQEEYNVYEKEFKRLQSDLVAQGNAQDVLSKVFNALFILGLNQEQFKEKLNTIYGSRDWPDIAVLSAELHIYAEATKRMSELRKDNNEGKIAAHATKTNEQVGPRKQCWNCGSFSHQKWGCDKPMRTCARCGKSGHMERFCLSYVKREEEGGRKQTEVAQASKNDKPRFKGYSKRGTTGSAGVPKGNKSKARTRLLKKVLANLINAEDDDNEEEEDDDEFVYEDDNEDAVADIVDVEEEA
jgi:hypothetical protein